MSAGRATVKRGRNLKKIEFKSWTSDVILAQTLLPYLVLICPAVWSVIKSKDL